MDAIFLDLPDIPGDSSIKGFEKKIECTSFSHGVSAQVTYDVSNENRTSGRPSHQDLTLTKYVDSATPLINQKCCEGANLGTVTVTIGRNDSGTILPFLIYTLDDCIISSASCSGGGGDKPTESISLNYSAIDWTYVSQKEAGGQAGKIVGVWDVSTNEAA